jgi:putative ABC transport system substrate-binding protein
MRRRRFIAWLGTAAAWPLAGSSLPAFAQQSDRTRHVGVLMNTVRDEPGGLADAAALRRGLVELGWVEGRNLRIDFRWPGGDIERVRAFAKELVGQKPDALIARSTPATATLKAETATIPIVFVAITEPLEQGLVQSLAQPGGNITGFTNFESSIGGKWLQLLQEVDPRVTRVAIIYNPQTAPFAGLFLRSVQVAAPTLMLETAAMPVQSEPDIEAAMTAFARQPGGGLVTIPDSFIIQHRDRIIALAARLHLPALYGSGTDATARGGLMSYTVDTQDLMQRAAGYVDRIFRGTKPAELPVRQPAKFALSLNLKTAKALGLDLAPTLVARADEVIE